jgi:hypothetical protein
LPKQELLLSAQPGSTGAVASKLDFGTSYRQRCR